MLQTIFHSPMVFVGFLGQALFGSRFVIQWIASERARASVVPTLFWWLSLGGGTTLLVYAIWRKDPVFIFGQAMGLVIYARNLVLIHKARRA
ncbi:MAG: lipid-A-disaccharide synthase N-terminal domain-containing protein [Roseovarius sp.]